MAHVGVVGLKCVTRYVANAECMAPGVAAANTVLDRLNFIGYCSILNHL